MKEQVITEYRIFDMHTHAFPKKIAAKAMSTLSDRIGFEPHYDGSLEGLKAYEKAGGAEGFLLLPIATNPASVPSINDWVASKRGKGVHAFGTMHPEYDDYEKELDRLVEMGIQGLKMHPEYQNFITDDERYFPVYEAIFNRGIKLYFHAGEDAVAGEVIKGSPRRIAKVCNTFSEGIIVAAHMGGLRQMEEAMEYLIGKVNVWIDTSSAAQRMRPEDVVSVARAHGTERVLFGSDAPWANFEDAVNAVVNAGFTPDELNNILFHNAAGLLGIN